MNGNPVDTDASIGEVDEINSAQKELWPEESYAPGDRVLGEDGVEYLFGEDGYWYAYDPAGQEPQTPANEQAVAVQMISEEPLAAESPRAPSATPSGTASAQQEEAKHTAPILDPPSSEAEHLRTSFIHFPAEESSFGVFSDVIIDIFCSRFFRVYLSITLYCSAALLIAVEVEYSFAILLRLFSPPSPKTNGQIEGLAYLAMFFFISFIAVSSIGVITDMAKQIWSQKRIHKSFWGMRNTILWNNEPPHIIYFFVISATLVMPFLWGLIEACTAKQSVVYMAQRFANVAVLASVFLIVICYVYFYGRGIYLKINSTNVYVIQRDDFALRERAYKNEPMKMAKVHWYHASTVLEEYGLDRDTLFYNTVVLMGLTPLFAIYTAQTMCTFIGSPTVVWGLLSSIGISMSVSITWLTCLDTKGQWSAYVTLLLVVALLVLGAVGGAMSAKPGTAGAVVVLFAISHGMLTRKRKHSLTRKEVLELVVQDENNEVSAAEANPSVWFDPYLCCCRSAFKDCMSCCFDTSLYFKNRHPKLVEAERRYARKHIALRTDQRVLLAWWLVLMILVACAVGLGNAVQYNFESTIATTSGTAVEASGYNPVCDLSFNTESANPFSTLDLALLGALSYTYGTNGDTDFATWFGSRGNFFRVYPERLPPNRNYATDGLAIKFSDYVDFDTQFHFITLNSNTRGLGVFRNIDDWGAVLALQAAQALSPLISLWPAEHQESFVRVSDLYHKIFPSYGNLDNVTAYIQNLMDDGFKEKILIIGDQFNGGYAKFLSATLGVPCVAFNPPGTKYTLSDYEVNGTQIVSTRSLWSYVDSLEDVSTTFRIPCSSKISMNKCSGILSTIEFLRDTCGDPFGRSTNLEV